MSISIPFLQIIWVERTGIIPTCMSTQKNRFHIFSLSSLVFDLQQVSGGAFGFIIVKDRARDDTIDPTSGTETQRNNIYSLLTNTDSEILVMGVRSSGNWINAKHEVSILKSFSLSLKCLFRAQRTTTTTSSSQGSGID